MPSRASPGWTHALNMHPPDHFDRSQHCRSLNRTTIEANVVEWTPAGGIESPTDAPLVHMKGYGGSES
eukprot:scaffold163549_cov31-Tisochrysis_lutea.AAC.3